MIPNLLEAQQISCQILVELTESGGNNNQNVQQIFTNLVSVPVSQKCTLSKVHLVEVHLVKRAPGPKGQLTKKCYGHTDTRTDALSDNVTS